MKWGKLVLTSFAILALAQITSANKVFKWKTIEFTNLTRDLNSMIDGQPYYNAENVIMTGFDYDMETGFICGAFSRLSGVPVTIGCFSAEDKSASPKFLPFPTAADNDLPGWPSNMDRELGQARFYNYRRGRGRFGAYYYEDDDDIVADEVRSHDKFRVANDKTKAFTGFSSLGNLFKKKDKKDVVVAVVDNSGDYGQQHHGSSSSSHYHGGHKWSSEENRWRPYRKDKDHHEQHNHHNGDDSGYVVTVADKDKKNPFFSFFDSFGSRISSVFNKNKEVTEKTPVFTINAPSRSSEEEHHHRPSRYRPSYHSSHNNYYSSEEEDDDRWTPTKRRKPSRYEYASSEEWYKQNEKPSNQNEERKLQSDLKSEVPLDKDTTNTPQIKPDLQAQLTVDVPAASSVSTSGSSEEQRPVLKPIRIQRPYNFISVRDTRFDKCGRLWFIDTGITEDSLNPIVYKVPTLWAFEVIADENHKLISRPYLKYELEDSSASGLRSLVVDIHENCDDYHVYIPNHKDNRLVVYSSRRGDHWQFAHPSLEPVTKEVDYTLNGEMYEFTGGIYSLAMGPRDEEGFRDIYYSAASGTGEYKVNTNLLRDRRAAPNRFHPKFFKSIGYRGEEGWSRGQVYDPRTEVIFFTSGNSIQCWNSNKILNPDTYGTVYDNMDLVHGADIKVDRKGNVWLLSNKYPLILSKGLDKSKYNFNLFRIKPREVIKGTVCSAPLQQRRNRALLKDEPTISDKGTESVSVIDQPSGATVEGDKVAIKTTEIVSAQTSDILEANEPVAVSDSALTINVPNAEEPTVKLSE